MLKLLCCLVLSWFLITVKLLLFVVVNTGANSGDPAIRPPFFVSKDLVLPRLGKSEGGPLSTVLSLGRRSKERVLVGLVVSDFLLGDRILLLFLLLL